MSTEVAVDIDDTNAPYWAGLRAGVLKYQSCSCGHRWLPARKLCPACLGADWQWQAATGGGVIKSWVVYHTAYHPDFKDRLPYNVAIVKLDEGPQLITNITAPHDRLRIGAQVRLAPDMKAAQPLATFALI
jgi:uncharacterized OB-fold protein